MSPVTSTRSSGPFGMDPGKTRVSARSNFVLLRAPARPLSIRHAVALADDVDVLEGARPERRGCPAAARRRGEDRAAGRRSASAIPQTSARDGEIGRHDDDRIGDRRDDQLMWREEIGGRRYPLRKRPGEGRRPVAATTNSRYARRRADRRAHPREPGAPFDRSSDRSDEMPERLAPERVAGLHRERVQGTRSSTRRAGAAGRQPKAAAVAAAITTITAPISDAS